MELRSSRTDLARIVEAAHRNKVPLLVVPAQSVRAWEHREPDSWARVCDWLAAHSIEIVEV
jgi:nucleoside phosphorylase